MNSDSPAHAGPSDSSADTRVDSNAPASSPTRVGATRPADVRPPKTDGTRYRPRRFHARGGLGEVYVADVLELNREAALKCLRSTAYGGVGRARFVREAAVTGRLGEHDTEGGEEQIHPASDDITQAGYVIVTSSYMSPEQANGQPLGADVQRLIRDIEHPT